MMLDPATRSTLLECLQPPEGFEFSEAIATTFSLDLVALLAAPLGFASTVVSADLRSEWTTDTALTVLRTLQQTATRITVFCDRAHLAVPKNGSPLMTLLESTIVPVRPPVARSAFHPKVWLTRYTGLDQPEEVKYRLLVLTRNLTFDRSLDLIACLEGVRRKTSIQARPSIPIRQFFEALSPLAINPASAQHRERVARMAEEVGRCDFVAQEPFSQSDWRFHAFGLPGARSVSPLTLEVKRRLIVSPFLSSQTLKSAFGASKETFVISRDCEFSDLGSQVLSQADLVLVPRRPLTEAISAETEPSLEGELTVQPGDLHAKCYVHEDGSASATWFVGSANATHSAFSRNVEVLLELTGPRRVVGIDALLPSAARSELSLTARRGNEAVTPTLQKNVGFADLWERFVPTKPVESEVLAEARANQDAADALACTITDVLWRGIVRSVDGGFSLTLELEAGMWWQVPDNARVTVRPLSVRSERPLTLTSNDPLTWSPLALESLTIFWPVSVLVGRGEVQGARHFLIVAPLIGAPPGREAAVTRSFLTDETQVVRFLELLLGADENAVTNEGGSEHYSRDLDADGVDVASPALLEHMLRAFAARPQRVAEAGRVIEDLASTEEGRSRLPKGLLELWHTFRDVLVADGVSISSHAEAT